MGTLTSIIPALTTAGKYIASNAEKISDVNAINTKNALLAQNAALQKQSNLLSAQQKETDRILKLNKAISTQRANFGSQGVGSVTGSGDSVLQGLAETSDIERQNIKSKTAMDNAIIDQNLKSQQQLNLLQKEQLKQKAALGLITNLAG